MEEKILNKQKQLVGSVCQGRQGLGFSKESKHPKKKTSKRDQIIQEVRTSEEEDRVAKAVQMGQQGAWTKWENIMKRDITWDELWKMTPLQAKFLITSVYDVLPTPSNLMIWGKKDDPTCILCGRWCNLEHILSSCSMSLASGRYTWRHNQALKVIAQIIHEQTKTMTKTNKKLPFINFRRSGDPVKTNPKRADPGILRTADDWVVTADLWHQSSFPQHIAPTTQRPDLILHSDATRQVIIIELTVPWETRVDEAHERKRLKYEDLRSDCTSNGWTTHYYPVEVGCRGLPAKSIIYMSRCLGISFTAKKKLLREVAAATERASCWIWTKYQQAQHQH